MAPTVPMRPARRLPRQGTLALVLIASGLGGCADDPAEQPLPVERAAYLQLDGCVQDWGSEADCEPQPSGATGEFNPAGMDQAGVSPGQSQGSAGTHSSVYGGHGGGGHVRWLGPYFSRNGTVYRYDGRIQPGQALPQHADALRAELRSPAQIYHQTTGRYASTPAHAQAASAKTARGRGGFGSIGRGLSGGG